MNKIIVVNNIKYEIVRLNENSNCYYFIIKDLNDKLFFLKSLKTRDKELMEALNIEIDFLNYYKSNNISKMISFKKDKYIMFEYIEGNNLNHCNLRNIREIIEIIIKLCDILNGIHKIGYSHNDIKKENIILSNDEIYLVDFGNCLKFGSTTSFCNYSTAPYELLNKLEVDNRSDIYSLGVVLYQLISKDDSRLDKYEIESNDKTIIEINKIIDKCTPKDKDKRYQSVLELKNDLIKLL